ncbi:MAG: Trk system potassium transporter TrkA [Ruminococcaceae bacterium]|nr:Trk system potassium transporter TrkA [Oscillospiraceae bacterium]
MKIIIVGDGQVGTTLTEYLAKEGYDITVIDNNPKVIANVVNMYDVMTVSGNGANYDVLVDAGAEKADLLIAAANSDEVNILSCLMAKKIGTKHTIARVRNPEYAQQLVFIREELGLSMVVNPEFEAAREISRVLRFPAAIKLDCFSKGRVELAEIKLSEKGLLTGRRLSELYKVCREKILICAVQRDEHVIIPDGNFVLAAGDKIHITGSHAALAAFFKDVKMFKEKSKRVMIIGGGKIAYYLGRHMTDAGIDIKIIEKNEKRCLELSEALPRATVICGDGTDQDTLIEEGLQSSDACVVLLGSDEENIIISLYVQSQGVEKVITEIERMSFTDMVESVGIDSFVSSNEITASRIIRYVRSMQVSEETSMKTLYKIVNNQAEAIEFAISHKTDYTDIPLKDLKTQKGILFAGIIRRGQVIIPGGNDCLQVGDSVIVVAGSGYNIKELEDVFES